MTYTTVTIPIDSAEDSELRIAQLAMLGFEGFEERPGQLLATIESASYDGDAVSTILAGSDYTVEEIPWQNWNAVWESNFEPVVVCNSSDEPILHIRASFHGPVSDGLPQITINPKMSFGTGHHATTYLMAREMQQMPFNGKIVFDFGTGTGILAIYAAMIGATRIAGIDNEENAIENAVENAALNGVEGIQFYHSDKLPAEGDYDIILANINLHVILENLEPLRKLCHSNTAILFSGLLASDLPQMENSLKKQGFKIQKVEYRNQWMLILAVPATSLHGLC